MPYVDHFFNHFLPSKMHMPLVEGMDSYTIAFSIEFTDADTIWIITVANGMITQIDQVADAPVKVRFKVSRDSFYRIVSKQISPQTAFFMRQTDIQGNLFEGMKLARILSYFFDNHPYTANKDERLEHNV